MKTRSCARLASLLLACSVPAGAASIDHKAVGCVVAERFPRLEARVTPPEGAARARVLFRAEGGQSWYAVTMTAEGEVLAAFLPKPLKTLRGLEYYIEVVDASLSTSRTPEVRARVAAEGGCGTDVTALGATVATVLMEAPAGAVAIPVGFSGAGVVAAGAPTGAGAAGAAAASGGGGIGAGTVAIGSGVLAAGAVGAVAAAGSGGEGDDDSDGNGSENGLHYSVRFIPSIDVSVCAGRALIWNSQSVVSNAGTFTETWSPGEPNTLRVTGSTTATTFTATLACVSGAASGTVSATGSRETYNGTFDFSSQRGAVTIVLNP